MPKRHETMIVGSGMHLMARCPICGDLGSMLRHAEGTPAERIMSFLSQATSSHKK